MIKDSVTQFRLSEDVLDIEFSASCEVWVDANTFKMVFNNLVDNAIKYNTGDLKLEVRATCNRKKIIINFKDNGIGIPVKEQKKVFNKFYRIYDKEIPNVKGTGLGLYWVKEIIKAHRGKISLNSAGKESGTVFKIELPLYKKNRSSSKKERQTNE
jgi:two-component system phosphate regulon sensor histidine kinase PhoR